MTAFPVMLSVRRLSNNDFLGGRLLSLVLASVQQQSNGSDCGIFAITFAAGLVFGIDSSHVNFDVPNHETSPGSLSQE